MPSFRPPLAMLVAALALVPGAGVAEETKGPLMDNSFLVEEAYNQEPGVVQQILSFTRDATGSGSWLASFTQEWPAAGQAHQLSTTVTFERWAPSGGGDGGRGLSDLLLNYRYQAAFEEGRLAFAPRLSLVVPTGGPHAGGSGYRGLGLQTNLAVSTTLAPALVTHSNLGATWVPSGAAGASFLAINAGQSFVWLPHPRFNVLLETVWTSTDSVAGGVTRRRQSLLVSPGVRWGVDLPHDVQVVVGVAMPLGVGPSAGERTVLGYLSVELPFWRPGAAPTCGTARRG